MRSWNAQQFAIDAILSEGFGAAFNVTSECFAKMSRTLTCVDGRTTSGGKIAIPGAGVLMDDEGREKTAKLLKKAGVKISGVRPHKKCGAENRAIRLLKESGASEADAQAEIKRRYEHMAYLLEVEVKAPAAMKNLHFHNERSLIISGVDHMDPSGFLDFHPFLINARFMPSIQDVLETVPFCLDIAFGDNGYGKEHFLRRMRQPGMRDDRSKFLIVIIGNPNPTKQDFCCHALREKLAPYLAAYKDLVNIVEYPVPKELLT